MTAGTHLQCTNTMPFHLLSSLLCTLNAAKHHAPASLRSIFGQAMPCTSHPGPWAFTTSIGRCAVQVMQGTAQPHAFTSSMPRPKSMVERPSSSTASDAIEAVYGRQELMESLPVEGFQCQLWEPSKAVLELEPGKAASLSGPICSYTLLLQTLKARCQAWSPADCSILLLCHRFKMGPFPIRGIIIVRMHAKLHGDDCAAKHLVM